MKVLGLINVPGWILAKVLLLTTVCLYTVYKQRYFKRLGIPSKATVFFLGDVLEISKKGLGYIDERMVRQNGKVFGVYMGNVPTLVIADTDMIKQIMVKEFSKFTDRPMIIPFSEKWLSGIFLAKGEHWRFLRRTLSPSFSSGNMRGMDPYIQKCLATFHEILDENIQRNPDGFDVAPFLSGYTLDVICSTGFGMDIDAQRDVENKFIKYSKEFLEFRGTRNFAFLFFIFFPDLAKLFHVKTDIISKEAFEFFVTTLKNAHQERQHENSTHSDLLQLLINKGPLKKTNEKSGETKIPERTKKRSLSHEEVLMNSITFMFAGYDTTSTTLQWLIYDVVTNPKCQEKLIQEIDKTIGDTEPTYDNVLKLSYLNMVVNETLRMHPPVSRINREALQDIKINGVQIKKGMDCTFSTEALHYMTEYWEEPQIYMPERFAPENKSKINEYAFMPFGQGPRNCIGKRLALLEVKATVVSLLQKYRFHITDTLKVPMPCCATRLVGLGKPDAPLFVKLQKRSEH